MQHLVLKSLAAALLLTGSWAASAAHLEVADHLGTAGYSGLLDGSAFSFDATDLSAGGDVALISTSTDSSHGHVADGYFTAASQNFSMSVTQYLASGSSYSGSSFVSLPVITLNIAADGEAAGTQVLVSFSGLASAFNSYGSGHGALGMDMSVTSGSSTLGSWLWDASEAGVADATVNFSFNAVVGQQVTLSGFMFSSLDADGSALVDASAAGALNGNFSITPVPEAGSYAMLLAGLGMIGLMARRHQR